MTKVVETVERRTTSAPAQGGEVGSSPVLPNAELPVRLEELKAIRRSLVVLRETGGEASLEVQAQILDYYKLRTSEYVTLGGDRGEMVRETGKVRDAAMAEIKVRRDAMIEEEKNRGWLSRSASTVGNALKGAGETSVDIVGGLGGYAVGAVKGVITGEGIKDGAVNTSADVLLGVRNFANKHLGGSTLEEVMTTDKRWYQQVAALHPVAHAGKVFEPVIDGINTGGFELQRLSYNVTGKLLGDSQTVSATEFRERMDQDGLLIAGKYSLKTGELAAATALTLSTGNATTLKAALLQTAKTLGSNVGMSAAGALSDEIYQANEEGGKFSVARFVGNTVEGTSASAMFMAGLSKTTSALAEARLAQYTPRLEKLREWAEVRNARGQKLFLARSKEIEARLVKNVQAAAAMGTEAVDASDGTSDAGQTADLFAAAKNGWQVAASVLKSAVNVYDTADVSLSGVKDTVSSAIGKIKLSEIASGEARRPGKLDGVENLNAEKNRTPLTEARVPNLDAAQSSRRQTETRPVQIVDDSLAIVSGTIKTTTPGVGKPIAEVSEALFTALKRAGLSQMGLNPADSSQIPEIYYTGGVKAFEAAGISPGTIVVAARSAGESAKEHAARIHHGVLHSRNLGEIDTTIGDRQYRDRIGIGTGESIDREVIRRELLSRGYRENELDRLPEQGFAALRVNPEFSQSPATQRLNGTQRSVADIPVVERGTNHDSLFPPGSDNRESAGVKREADPVRAANSTGSKVLSDAELIQLDNGQIPDRMREIWRVVDETSPAGREFRASTLALLKQHCPKDLYDFSKGEPQIFLVDDPTPNAFVLTAGSRPMIFVHKGLFSETELPTSYRAEHQAGYHKTELLPGSKEMVVSRPEELLAVLFHELEHFRLLQQYGEHSNSKLEEGDAYVAMVTNLQKAGLNPHYAYSVMAKLVGGRDDVSPTLREFMDPHPIGPNTLQIIYSALGGNRMENDAVPSHSLPAFSRSDSIVASADSGKFSSQIDKLLGADYEKLMPAEKADRLAELFEKFPIESTAVLKRLEVKLAEIGPKLNSGSEEDLASIDRLYNSALDALAAIDTPQKDTVSNIQRFLYEFNTIKGPVSSFGRVRTYNDAIKIFAGALASGNEEQIVAASQAVVEEGSFFTKSGAGGFACFSQGILCSVMERGFKTYSTETAGGTRLRSIPQTMPDLHDAQQNAEGRTVPWAAVYPLLDSNPEVLKACLLTGLVGDSNVLGAALRSANNSSPTGLDPLDAPDYVKELREEYGWFTSAVSGRDTNDRRFSVPLNSMVIAGDGEIRSNHRAAAVGPLTPLEGLDLKDPTSISRYTSFLRYGNTDKIREQSLELFRSGEADELIKLRNGRLLTDQVSSSGLLFVEQFTENPEVFIKVNRELLAVSYRAQQEFTGILKQVASTPGGAALVHQLYASIIPTQFGEMDRWGTDAVLSSGYFGAARDKEAIIKEWHDAKVSGLDSPLFNFGNQEAGLSKAERAELLKIQIEGISRIPSDVYEPDSAGHSSYRAVLKTKSEQWARFVLNRASDLTSVNLEPGKGNGWADISQVCSRAVGSTQAFIEREAAAASIVIRGLTFDRNQDSIPTPEQLSAAVSEINRWSANRHLPAKKDIFGGLSAACFEKHVDRGSLQPLLNTWLQLRKEEAHDTANEYAVLDKLLDRLAKEVVDPAKRCEYLGEVISSGTIHSPAGRAKVFSMYGESFRGVLGGADHGAPDYLKPEHEALLSEVADKLPAVHREQFLRVVADSIEAQSTTANRLFQIVSNAKGEGVGTLATLSYAAEPLVEMMRADPAVRTAVIDFAISSGSSDDAMTLIRAIDDSNARAVQKGDSPNRVWKKYSEELSAEERISHLRTLHDNISAAPLEMKALLGVLIGADSTKSRMAQEQELFAHVLAKRLPQNLNNREKIQMFAESYLAAREPEERPLILAALLLGAQQQPGAQVDAAASLGEAVVSVISRSNVADAKLAQQASCHPDTLPELRKPLEKAKYDANPDPRWESTRQVEELRQQIEQQYTMNSGASSPVTIARIGRRLGSASINNIIELQMSDGKSLALALRRPGAQADAERGFDILDATVEGYERRSGTRSPLRSSLGHSRDRIALETDVVAAEPQLGLLGRMYQDVKAVFRGETYTFSAPTYFGSGEKIDSTGQNLGFFLMDKMEGQVFSKIGEAALGTPSESAFKNSASVLLSVEYSNILRGLFDFDRHGGQVLQNGNNFAHLDPKAIRVKEWTAAEKQDGGRFIGEIAKEVLGGRSIEDALTSVEAKRGALPEIAEEIKRAMISLGEYSRHLTQKDQAACLISALRSGIDSNIRQGISAELSSQSEQLAELLQSNLRFVPGARVFARWAVNSALGSENGWNRLVGAVSFFFPGSVVSVYRPN